MTAPFTFTVTGSSGRSIDLEAYEVPGHPGILVTAHDDRWGVTHRKSGASIGTFKRWPGTDYAACVAAAFDSDPGLVAAIDAAVPSDYEPGSSLPTDSPTLAALRSRMRSVEAAYRQAVNFVRMAELVVRGEHLVEVELVRRATVLVSIEADTPEAAVDIARDLPGHHFAYGPFEDPEVEIANISASGELPEMRFDRHGDPR